ncbi:hypothetical protein ACFYRN_45115 [Streptomyces sp. NPDC005227]|uniref:hypothetical protein n=1 Tax=Streptomyces sp. NPDC005227 TaxID=3364707 RepID=UPI0036A7A0B2
MAEGEPAPDLAAHGDDVVTATLGELKALAWQATQNFPPMPAAWFARPVDHLVAALLTVAAIDVIGGVANAERRVDQVSIVDGLLGILATMTDPWLAAYGSRNTSGRGPNCPVSGS